ncbi:MAG: hypothetical protein LBV38_04615 [Alistipes sp.]|jgi:hypothetical protein|nr:hypothetical protein [Alistipes sp.]
MIVDIAEVNRNSPYKISLGSDGETFTFSTDNGIDYKVSFMRDDSLFKGLVVRRFSLYSDWAKGERHIYDPLVRETVFQILGNFLSRDNQVLVYVCNNDDGLHRYRDKLFGSWFSQADKLAEKQFVRRAIEYSAEGISFYAGLVCRSDNNLKELYLEALYQEMQLLEDK